jgi:hypothetical protein
MLGNGEIKTELKTEADVAAWLFTHGRQWHEKWLKLPDGDRAVATRALIRRINASTTQGTPRNELNEAISELLGFGSGTLPTPANIVNSAIKKTGRPATITVTPDQLRSALQGSSALHEVAKKLEISKKTLWNKIAGSSELRAIWDARKPGIDGRSDRSRKDQISNRKPMITKDMVEDAFKKESRKLPTAPTDAEFINVLIEGSLWRMRKITLRSGGLLFVACDVNLFTLAREDRDQLFSMVDLLDQIAQDQQE